MAERQIGATLEEWYPTEAVYSFGAPGEWESTERATAAPSALRAVWSDEAAQPTLQPGGGAATTSGFVTLPFASTAPTPAQPHLAPASAAAASAAPAPAPAPATAAQPSSATTAPPRAAWGKLSAELRASATTVPPALFSGLAGPSGAPGGGGGGGGSGGGGGGGGAGTSFGGIGGYSDGGGSGSGSLGGLDFNALSILSSALQGGGGGAHPMRPSAEAAAAALSSMLAAAAAAQGFAPQAPPPPQRPQDRPGNTLCTFFLTGPCRFGDLCKFRHAKAEPWAVEYFENLLLERLERTQAGEEEEGEEGEGAAAQEDGQPSSSSSSSSSSRASAAAAQSEAEFAAASRAWLGATLEAQQAVLLEAVAAGVCSDLDAAEVALGAAERGISRSIECSVCLENVTDAAGRRFGLLTGCAHAFCLECIREWRARIDLPPATVRACPLCRKLSYYVIPSDRYVCDAGRKARLSEEYHAAQRALPCRMFDQGRGSCPFGTSCFYAHLLPDGSAAPVARHTFRVNTEGEIKGVGKKPTLADFLFTK